MKETLRRLGTSVAVIGHNINKRMADPPFMTAITTNPDLETMVRSEVCLTLKKR